ncbi:MAG: ankyrin repeat domain-containing protein, partial [Verrucomicrobiales bacterium]
MRRLLYKSMTSPPRELAILTHMKTIILSVTLFLASASTQAIADGPIEKKLQQALFAEEGTRDLKKAIEAYNAVIADYDQQRQFAATAVFRLAECHRKLGEREAAVAAYQRLLKEFPEDQTLTRLASENLRSLGAGSGEAKAAPALATDAAEIARIENLVALSPDLINDPETGLLHKAAAKSQLRVAEFLLESGADINLRSRDNLQAQSGFRTLRPTPVSVAASGGHLAMVKFLLERGAEVDDHTIIMAGTRKRTAVLDVLIDHLPTDPEMQFHILRAACSIGRPDFVAALVEAGAPLTTEANYSTPLMLAVEKRDLESIKILLGAGSEPDGDTLLLAVGSGTPTFNAIWNSGVRSPDAFRRAIDNADIAMTIINGIEDIDQTDRDGATALGIACNHLKPDYVRAILARGAQPDQLCSIKLSNTKLENITPLIGALNSHAHTDSKEKYEEALNAVITLLIEAGADIDARDLRGYTALVYA